MQDSRWAHRAWDDPYATSQYLPQAGSPEELRTRDALEAVREPREVVQLHRTPGLNDPHPIRDLAYLDDGSRRAIGIRDVLSQPRPFTESRDFSGSPAGFMGTSRDSQGSVFG